MLGMLGIAVHSELHSSWDAIRNCLEVAQLKVADKIQKTDLEKAMEAMKQSGFRQVNDRGNMILATYVYQQHGMAETCF